MAQEDNSDLGGTFSTLNINAMEFVPSFSFRPRSAAPTLDQDEDGSAAAAVAAETAPSLSAVPAAAVIDDNSAANTNNTTSAASTPTTPPDQQPAVPNNDLDTLPSSDEVETNITDNPIETAEVNAGFINDHTYCTVTAVPSDVLADETPENAGKLFMSGNLFWISQ